MTVPRGITIMPDQFKTKLRFWKAFAMNLSASTVGGVRFQPSAAFNPDPLTADVPKGFAQFAAFYGSYRVHSSTCKVEVVNPSSVTPVQVCLLPVNLDPGASPTAPVVVGSIEQPYAKRRMSSLVGGPLTTITSEMSTERIFGSSMVRTDDNFASLTNTIPVNNWFWFITFYSLAVIPGGIVAHAFIDMDITFYDRLRLN